MYPGFVEIGLFEMSYRKKNATTSFFANINVAKQYPNVIV
ncbi:hypothetical protein DSUL_20083 [Desulfovibrionales bacterium]